MHTNEIKMAEAVERVAFLSLCHRRACLLLEVNVGGDLLRVFGLDRYDSQWKQRRKEILLASQHKRGWLLIEWRGC